MEKLLWAYTIDEDDEIRSEIDSLLNLYSPRIYFSKNPLLNSPSREDLVGDISFGAVYQGDCAVEEFRLNANDLTRHIAIYGQTGHGKTMLHFHVIDQLIRMKIPFLYFDPKQDGRKLFRKYPELVILSAKSLPWNPLRNPPRMDVKSYWQLFTEACGHSWGVYHAGVNYLSEFLDELYINYQKTGRFPTVKKLFTLMVETEEKTKKRTEYYDVMYNRVRTLVSIFGDVLDEEQGLPIEKLLEMPVVIELDQLRADIQSWFVEVMLTFVYAHRLSQGHRGEELRHVIFADEAHRIWDANKEWRDTTREMGMPTINIFPTQFRDFGEALIINSQEPSKITQSMHANTLVKIVGNLGSGIDINSISEAMGLNEEETNSIHKLKRGQWIVRMSDRFTEPFLIETPKIEYCEVNISNDEVQTRAKPILEKFCIRTREIADSKPEQHLPELSPDAEALIFNICVHPFTTISKQYELLGFVGEKANKAKTELIEKRLTSETSIVMGSRKVKFLIPTELGLWYLESAGQNTKLWRSLGNSSFEHRFYQVMVAFAFKNLGYQTSLEKVLSCGTRVDVLASNKDKYSYAIEVELDSNLNVHNKLRCLEEVNALIVLSKDQQVLENTKTMLKQANADQLSRIGFYQIGQFIDGLRQNIITEIFRNGDLDKK